MNVPEVSEINSDNYPTAIAAIRDILYMYYDMTKSYGGFGHNIETGHFDPIFFINSYLHEPPGYSFEIDLEILHKGSAVSLLCELSDQWDDHEEVPSGDLTEKLQRLLSEDRFRHLPLAEECMALALADEQLFRDKLQEVYLTYVESFFRSLIR